MVAYQTFSFSCLLITTFDAAGYFFVASLLLHIYPFAGLMSSATASPFAPAAVYIQPLYDVLN